ncbi:MAG TPA: hypothetical protein VGR28_09910 [Candidatus Thermoplasmatota archaeon]|jgi:hypothetical protein|nr:hypothetical protein [Candidatus Thermoplasmatota archaeon]
MPDYVLRGKVIDAQRLPMVGARVQGWDDDPLLNPDDLLGETTTDARGRFELRFDQRKFAAYWELLEGSPDVYVVVFDAGGRELLQTRVQTTGHEISYHIRIAPPPPPEPHARDLYADNPRRTLAMLADVGATMGAEQRINLDLLANPQLPQPVRQRVQAQVDGYQDRMDNFNELSALLSGVANATLEEYHLGLIGHDGPQVPRQPRRAPAPQVIIWPRQEASPWA